MFVMHRGTSYRNIENQNGTSNFMVPVPLFDWKFPAELAATGAGISNRRHWCVPEVKCRHQNHIKSSPIFGRFARSKRTMASALVDAVGASGAVLTTVCWGPQAVKIIRD